MFINKKYYVNMRNVRNAVTSFSDLMLLIGHGRDSAWKSLLQQPQEVLSWVSSLTGINCGKVGLLTKTECVR